MTFATHPYYRFPVHCAVTYNAVPFQCQGTVWNLSCTCGGTQEDLPMHPGEGRSLVIRQWCGDCLPHLKVHCLLGHYLLQLPIVFFLPEQHLYDHNLFFSMTFPGHRPPSLDHDSAVDLLTHVLVFRMKVKGGCEHDIHLLVRLSWTLVDPFLYCIQESILSDWFRQMVRAAGC